MRQVPILSDQYYHVYNRGNLKQEIFINERDYVRFLFLIIYLQSKNPFRNIGRKVTHFLRHHNFGIDEKDEQEVLTTKEVEVIAFCIMPNHFHLCLKSSVDNGISNYLHRISTGYAKYFNTKYDQTGHVFQGTFKARMVMDENYLFHLSAYIHNNPSELTRWKRGQDVYPWSSFQDYRSNRWGALLQPNEILDSFNDFEEYKSYVLDANTKNMFDDEHQHSF